MLAGEQLEQQHAAGPRLLHAGGEHLLLLLLLLLLSLLLLQLPHHLWRAVAQVPRQALAAVPHAEVALAHGHGAPEVGENHTQPAPP
jgi:hypothetical protein